MNASFYKWRIKSRTSTKTCVCFLFEEERYIDEEEKREQNIRRTKKKEKNIRRERLHIKGEWFTRLSLMRKIETFTYFYRSWDDE